MIKSKLLASTMLVSAAALVAAGSANAMKLNLGGFIEFWTGYADTDKTNVQDNDFDVKQDAEINFLAEETLDNGWKVGARFELEAGNGNDNGGTGTTAGFDESFGWLKTPYGQVNIGNNDVATGYIGGVSTVGPVGITKSDLPDWDNQVSQELDNTDVDLGVSDAQNITYFSPKVAGVQLIVSYTPDSSNAVASDYDDNEAGGLHNAWSGAVKYNQKFGKTSIYVAAGYTTVEGPDAGGGGDANGYGMTGKVGFGPVLVSASYASENNLADTDSYWAIAGRYKMGKNALSVGYSEAEEDDKGGAGNVGGVGKGTHEIFTVGYERKLGKGVTAAASVFYGDDKEPGTTKTDVTGAVAGFKIKF